MPGFKMHSDAMHLGFWLLTRRWILLKFGHHLRGLDKEEAKFASLCKMQVSVGIHGTPFCWNTTSILWDFLRGWLYKSYIEFHRVAGLLAVMVIGLNKFKNILQFHQHISLCELFFHELIIFTFHYVVVSSFFFQIQSFLRYPQFWKVGNRSPEVSAVEKPYVEVRCM